VGKGLMFISLDVGVLDVLRAELEGRGVDVMDGQWGYRLMVMAEPALLSLSDVGFMGINPDLI
jgi:hypothetical protein